MAVVQVVTMLAFKSNDPSSNPTEVYNISVKINKKAAGVGPFLNKTLSFIELWESFSAIVLIRAKSLSHTDIYIKQFHLSKHF